VANYFEGGAFPLQLEEQSLRKGRSIRDGYARGWGLEFGGIRNYVLADPIYRQAMALAQGRTIQAENCRMNLFLLAKYFLPRILDESAGGSIVEFGSFRGGSAIFLASVCRSLGLNVKVYGLDTFEGMPPTDKGVDAHNAGDFGGVDLDELRTYVESCGLSERLEFVQGIFESTAPALLARIPPVLLAHIDCDVYDSVAYAWEAVKSHVCPGGYVVFDDAHASGCLGATEVVEDLVIRRDGLNCEQIWPHFVFRVRPPSGQGQTETNQSPEHTLLEYRFSIQRLEGELADATRNSARLQQRYDQSQADLGETRARLEQTLRRLADLEAAHTGLERARGQLQELHDQCLADLDQTRSLLEQTQRQLAGVEAARADLDRAHGSLKRQVNTARTSRWLRMGRLFGVGPEFEIQE
jgi:predicted O-methyltransferase YrrM